MTNVKGFRSFIVFLLCSYVIDAQLISSDNAQTMIPLRDVDVNVQLLDVVGDVSIQQKYFNSNEDPIEAVYRFPLDEAAAVYSFEALFEDGTRLISEVMKRDDAQVVYDDALKQGKQAILLSEERSDVFTALIGSIPANSSVTITLKYAAELDMSQGFATFVLPTVIAPRYGSPDSRLPGDGSSPPIDSNVPYSLSVSIDATMPSKIESIDCPTHPVKVVNSEDGMSAQVSLSQVTPLDRDFIVNIQHKSQTIPRSWTETWTSPRGATSTVNMLVANPEKADLESSLPSTESREIYILIDRSGSMTGDKIGGASRALSLLVSSLPSPSDSVVEIKFQIVGFGSRHRSLFDSPQILSDESVQTAQQYAKTLQADFGGTEILSPLAEIFDSEIPSKTARDVLLITDGEVWNVDELLSKVSSVSENTPTRVFAIGIGASVSHSLVRGLARAGRGVSAVIVPGSVSLESVVIDSLTRILSPSIDGYEIDWGSGGSVQVAPFQSQPIFASSGIIRYGRFPSPSSSPSSSISISKLPNANNIIPQPIINSPPGLLHRLWARTLIRDLEEDRSFLSDEKRRGVWSEEELMEEVQKQCVALSAMFNLSSRFASFVSVMHDDDDDDEKRQRPKRVIVPQDHPYMEDHVLQLNMPISSGAVRLESGSPRGVGVGVGGRFKAGGQKWGSGFWGGARRHERHDVSGEMARSPPADFEIQDEDATPTPTPHVDHKKDRAERRKKEAIRRQNCEFTEQEINDLAALFSFKGIIEKCDEVVGALHMKDSEVCGCADERIRQPLWATAFAVRIIDNLPSSEMKKAHMMVTAKGRGFLTRMATPENYKSLFAEVDKCLEKHKICVA